MNTKNADRCIMGNLSEPRGEASGETGPAPTLVWDASLQNREETRLWLSPPVAFCRAALLTCQGRVTLMACEAAPNVTAVEHQRSQCPPSHRDKRLSPHSYLEFGGGGDNALCLSNGNIISVGRWEAILMLFQKSL